MSLSNYTREPDAHGFKCWRHKTKPVLLMELYQQFPEPRRYVAVTGKERLGIFKTLEEAAEAGEVAC